MRLARSHGLLRPVPLKSFKPGRRRNPAPAGAAAPNIRHYGPVTLEQSGTYTLLANPRDDDTSEFELMVRPDE